MKQFVYGKTLAAQDLVKIVGDDKMLHRRISAFIQDTHNYFNGINPKAPLRIKLHLLKTIRDERIQHINNTPTFLKQNVYTHLNNLVCAIFGDKLIKIKEPKFYKSGCFKKPKHIIPDPIVTHNTGDTTKESNEAHDKVLQFNTKRNKERLLFPLDTTSNIPSQMLGTSDDGLTGTFWKQVSLDSQLKALNKVLKLSTERDN